MTFTVYDIIRLALLDIGAIAKSEALDADESADALKILNMLLDEWSAESTMVLGTVMESHTLVASDGSYTIGASGADITSSKPTTITEAFVRDSDSNDSPVRVVSLGEWNSYGDKTGTGRPESLYYDPGATQQAVHKGTINLYPVPDSSTTYTLFFGGQKPLTEFTAVANTVTLAPAYLRALRLNLAVDLWPQYFSDKGAPVPDAIKREAQRARAVIEAMNSKQVICGMDIPGQTGGGFNVYAGD